jgi:hypothetical protein
MNTLIREATMHRLQVDEVLNVVSMLNQEIDDTSSYPGSAFEAIFREENLYVEFLGAPIWDAETVGMALPVYDDDDDESVPDGEEGDDDYDEEDQEYVTNDIDELETHLRTCAHRHLSSLNRGLRKPVEDKKPRKNPRVNGRSLRVTIQGQRGSGKSTIAQLFASELSKWGLRVEVDDPDASHLAAAQVAQSLAGLQAVETDVIIVTDQDERFGF